MEIIADTLNEAFKQSLIYLNDYGVETHPRGTTCKELMGFKMIIKNPRARIITEPARKLSLAYAVGEFIFYMSGSNSLEQLAHYSKRVRQFSDDGITISSAYGHRIFGFDKGINLDQWNYVLNKLRYDKDSRQAIMHINTPADMFHESKDFPCTMSLQFFIRDNKLHLINHMRSNDAIWGLGYDAYSFTMIQEIMAMQLGVDLGEYIHFAGSYHIYDRHFEMMKEIIDSKNELPGTMPNMPAKFITSTPYAKSDLSKLIQYEADIRLDRDHIPELETDYAKAMYCILKDHKEKRDAQDK